MPLSTATGQPEQIIAACGKPKFDTRVLGLRALHYRAGDFNFELSDGSYVFRNVTANGRTYHNLNTAMKAFPCVVDVHWIAPEKHIRAVAPPLASTGPDFTGYLFTVIAVALLALLGFAAWGNRRAWNDRPKRLCTNCYTLAQPLQHKNKRWYCGRCGADNPAPLDSPVAQAFLSRQNAQSHVIEGRNLP